MELHENIKNNEDSYDDNYYYDDYGNNKRKSFDNFINQYCTVIYDNENCPERNSGKIIFVCLSYLMKSIMIVKMKGFVSQILQHL
jgi:hypothetical protein